jgi:hypothetical protein
MLPPNRMPPTSLQPSKSSLVSSCNRPEVQSACLSLTTLRSLQTTSNLPDGGESVPISLSAALVCFVTHVLSTPTNVRCKWDEGASRRFGTGQDRQGLKPRNLYRVRSRGFENPLPRIEVRGWHDGLAWIKLYARPAPPNALPGIRRYRRYLRPIGFFSRS